MSLLIVGESATYLDVCPFLKVYIVSWKDYKRWSFIVVKTTAKFIIRVKVNRHVHDKVLCTKRTKLYTNDWGVLQEKKWWSAWQKYPPVSDLSVNYLINLRKFSSWNNELRNISSCALNADIHKNRNIKKKNEGTFCRPLDCLFDLFAFTFLWFHRRKYPGDICILEGTNVCIVLIIHLLILMNAFYKIKINIFWKKVLQADNYISNNSNDSNKETTEPQISLFTQTPPKAFPA